MLKETHVFDWCMIGCNFQEHAFVEKRLDYMPKICSFIRIATTIFLILWQKKFQTMWNVNKLAWDDLIAPIIINTIINIIWAGGRK